MPKKKPTKKTPTAAGSGGGLPHDKLKATRERVHRERAQQRGEDLVELEHEEYVQFHKDADRARRSRQSLASAGRARRGEYKVAPETLQEAFAAWRGKVKHRTQACRRVAQEYGVSTETVRKYTKDQEW